MPRSLCPLHVCRITVLSFQTPLLMNEPMSKFSFTVFHLSSSRLFVKAGDCSCHMTVHVLITGEPYLLALQTPRIWLLRYNTFQQQQLEHIHMMYMAKLL